MLIFAKLHGKMTAGQFRHQDLPGRQPVLDYDKDRLPEEFRSIRATIRGKNLEQ